MCVLVSGLRVAPLIDERTGREGTGSRLEEGIDQLSGELLPVVAVEESVVQGGWRAIPQRYRRMGFEVSARLLKAELRAREGVDSFSTFESVSLRIAPARPDARWPPVQLGHCGGINPCSPRDRTLRFEGSPDLDFTRYLDEDRLELTLALVGQPPIWTWTFDVDVCLAVRGNYRAGL